MNKCHSYRVIFCVHYTYIMKNYHSYRFKDTHYSVILSYYNHTCAFPSAFYSFTKSSVFNTSGYPIKLSKRRWYVFGPFQMAVQIKFLKVLHFSTQQKFYFEYPFSEYEIRYLFIYTMFSFKDFSVESKQSGNNCTVVQYYK